MFEPMNIVAAIALYILVYLGLRWALARASKGHSEERRVPEHKETGQDELRKILQLGIPLWLPVVALGLFLMYVFSVRGDMALWYLALVSTVAGVFVANKYQRQLRQRYVPDESTLAVDTVKAKAVAEPTVVGAPEHVSTPSSQLDELSRLAALKDAGHLTAEEYELLKKRVLERS